MEFRMLQVEAWEDYDHGFLDEYSAAGEYEASTLACASAGMSPEHDPAPLLPATRLAREWRCALKRSEIVRLCGRYTSPRSEKITSRLLQTS